MSKHGLYGPGFAEVPLTPFPESVNHAYGSDAINIVRPTGAKGIVLITEAGTHRIRAGNVVPLNFTAEADNDTFTTAVDHNYNTGDGPYLASNSGGALPTGIDNVTPYWIIKLTATTYKLATSKANALAGTAVAISTDGTPTHTLTGTIAAPTGDVTNGDGSVKVPTASQLVMPAPDILTVKGTGASDILTYWFF